MKINIKGIMDLKGISMYKICKDTGIAQSTMSRIYNNKTTKISFEVLELICGALECTPNDIIISENSKVSKLIEHEYQVRKIYESKDNVE